MDTRELGEASSSTALPHLLDALIAQVAAECLGTCQDGVHGCHEREVLLPLNLDDHLIVHLVQFTHRHCNDIAVDKVVAEPVLVSLVVDQLSLDLVALLVDLVGELGPDQGIPSGDEDTLGEHHLGGVRNLDPGEHHDRVKYHGVALDFHGAFLVDGEVATQQVLTRDPLVIKDCVAIVLQVKAKLGA